MQGEEMISSNNNNIKGLNKTNYKQYLTNFKDNSKQGSGKVEQSQLL